MNLLTKYVIALGLMLGCSQGFAFDCRGAVALTGTTYTSDAYLNTLTADISQLAVGSTMALGSPITMDTEQEIQLDVVSTEATKAGVEVIAKAHGEDGLYSFVIGTVDGVTQITNFKGFEANVPFGPATLICE